jgi:hypothetical protein
MGALFFYKNRHAGSQPAPDQREGWQGVRPRVHLNPAFAGFFIFGRTGAPLLKMGILLFVIARVNAIFKELFPKKKLWFNSNHDFVRV